MSEQCKHQLASPSSCPVRLSADCVKTRTRVSSAHALDMPRLHLVMCAFRKVR